MDFTYVRTWAGFTYVLFIVDVFAQKIIAWNAATSKDVNLVMTPLRMAIWQRQREGHPIEPGELIGHADAGSQGGFNWSSQHLEVMEVFDGGEVGLEQEDQRCSRGRAAAVACGSGVAPGDAFAGFADAVAGGAAAVLASDRHGHQLG